MDRSAACAELQAAPHEDRDVRPAVGESGAARTVPVSEVRYPRQPVAVALERVGSTPPSVPAPAAAMEAGDPDHHLWRNGRLWWVAFTVHRGHLQERVRVSLGTADRAEARRRRDALLARYAGEPGCALSLRFAPRRAARAGVAR